MSKEAGTEEVKAAPVAQIEKVAVKKERIGEVVSDKMTKTIVVEVVRRKPHPQYKKIIKVSKRFYAHDEKSEAKIGDRVRIVETRPMSRLKRWALVEILKH